MATRTRTQPDDLQAGQPGTMTAATIAVFIAPFPLVIRGILARAGAAGTTGTSNTDVRINGVSIFASGAAGVQFASGSTTPTYGTIAAANPPTLKKGDVVTVVNTVVHTTPITNFIVALSFQFHANANITAISTDSLAPEQDTNGGNTSQEKDSQLLNKSTIYLLVPIKSESS
jgi:hypothetical protein